MENFEIGVRKCCDNCVGEGYVTHPKWMGFYEWQKQEKEKTGKYPEHEENIAWLNENFSNYKKTKEEIECHNCKGNGLVEDEIEFSTLKQLIIEP